MKRFFRNLPFFFLFLSCAASAFSLTSFIGPTAPPLPTRLININFYVDDRHFLERPFLEVSLIEEKFRKKIVAVESKRVGKMGSGFSTLAVPEGSVHLYVCGLINCHTGRESEMVCGKTLIPSELEMGKDHEVTFSTAWACQ